MSETDAPDPRPRVDAEDGVHRLAGARCTACGHLLARTAPRCPRCAGPVEAASFGPSGRLWALTRVHVAARPGEELPYVIGYVDLDAGPRLLVRLADPSAPAAVGAAVRLVNGGATGDPTVELVA